MEKGKYFRDEKHRKIMSNLIKEIRPNLLQETKEKISLSMKGKTWEVRMGEEKAKQAKNKLSKFRAKENRINNPSKNKITANKISETRKRLYKEGKLKTTAKCFQKGSIPWNTNKNHPKYQEYIETIRKIGKRDKTEEHRLELSISRLRNWGEPIYKENQIKAILKGLMVRPTSFEKKIADLCIENSLPFVYTGNGTFLINFKNPDFVNEKDKVVIEVFYSWFKIRDYGSVENYKEFCKKKYNSAGWKVIFIDETEVDVDNWKELCLNKIIMGEVNV